VYSTVGDIHLFWHAVTSGRVVSRSSWSAMTQPRSWDPDNELRHGLGLWLGADDDSIRPEGYDAGASYRSVHMPSAGVTHTVISNTSEGTWPMSRRLIDQFG
jgi:hypothetical protein